MPPAHTHTLAQTRACTIEIQIGLLTLFALARPLRCDVLCRLNEKELEINEIQLPLPFGTYAQQQPMAAVERIQRVALACALSQSPSSAFTAHTCACVRFVCAVLGSYICVCADFYHSLLIAADMTRRRARCFVFVCIALGRGERTNHWSTLTQPHTLARSLTLCSDCGLRFDTPGLCDYFALFRAAAVRFMLLLLLQQRSLLMVFCFCCQLLLLIVLLFSVCCCCPPYSHSHSGKQSRNFANKMKAL